MKEFIDKLIERLEELNTFKLGLADAMSELMNKGRVDNYISKEEVVTIANQLAVEYKVSEMPTGWIPCSERLPEADHYVLCQGNNSMFVACVDSFDAEWRDNHFYKRTNVKAWCELPAPYTEGE